MLKVKSPSLWLLLGIIAIYFLLRLPNLTSQPIFADEAIYIRWAQIAKSVPDLRFISLQDGKTPLFMWLMAPFLILFQDPLFAGRLLSVVSGLFTLLGVWKIGNKFFNNRVGFLAAFLVAVTPFMVFFDRMALVDSMLAAFTTWAIYLGLSLAQKPNYKNAILLGVVIGASWLTKTPGMVNLAMLPLYLIFFNFKKEKRNSRIIKYGSFFILAGFIAVVMYYIQRIDPNFHQLSARNSDYVHPWTRLLQYPLDPFIPHFKDTIGYFISLFGWPLILLIPGALILPWIKKNKVALLILLWSVLPFCYELQFIKAYTARYILYSIPPLLILIAWELDLLSAYLTYYFNSFMKKEYFTKVFLSLILIAIIIWPVLFISQLLTDPTETPLAKAEKNGYLEDWTAGYGFKDIAQYLESQSQNQIVIVGTEGGFGTLPEGVWIYLDKNKNVIFKPGKDFFPQSTVAEAKNHPTYFIANRPLNLSSTPYGTLIKTYQKPAEIWQEPNAILFYKVNP